MSDIQPNNRFRIYRCKSWTDFANLTKADRFLFVDEKTRHFGFRPIFRGHGNLDWPLSSTMERNIYSHEQKVIYEGREEGMNLRKFNGVNWYNRICESILSNFKNSVRGMHGIISDFSELEYWALGRHYGLLSPYLDWTESAYVAAFFAFEEEIRARCFGYPIPSSSLQENDFVYVWAIRRMQNLEIDDEFNIVQMRGWHDSRARAQNSIFSILKSKDHIDIISYLASRNLLHYLERYDLPKTTFWEAIHDFDRMNIRYSTLFPDIHGAAYQSNLNAEIIRLGIMSFTTGQSPVRN